MIAPKRSIPAIVERIKATSAAPMVMPKSKGTLQGAKRMSSPPLIWSNSVNEIQKLVCPPLQPNLAASKLPNE